MIHGLGGNLIRLLYAVSSVLVPRDERLAVVFPDTLDLATQAVAMSSLEERVARLDEIADVLERVSAALSATGADRYRLSFEALDAYVAGVDEFNAGLQDSDRVQLLLTSVTAPPRWIIEAPSTATLAAHGSAHTFASLWERYLDVHDRLYRLLLRRYVAEPRRRGHHAVVCAFELGNEPDYCWIPAELKIEWGADVAANPRWKYVTELHLSQVPERQSASIPFEKTPTGYQNQDGEWTSALGPPTPIAEFKWGAKFDWYVRCFADLHHRTAEALAREASAHDVDPAVVSASVTHNNLEYLLRMVRANPHAFDHVTGIGLHPYHWPRNDVWDDRFVGARARDDWAAASPRLFASDYFKHFGFLEEVSACTAGVRRGELVRRAPVSPPELNRALAGKSLWLTEFGIGSTSRTTGLAAVTASGRSSIGTRKESGTVSSFTKAISRKPCGMAVRSRSSSETSPSRGSSTTPSSRRSFRTSFLTDPS